MIRDLILKNRTYRRFYQEVKLDRETIMEWIDLARLSSSAANKQSLKYIISTDEEKNEEIFKNIRWAGYLKDWPGPEEGERPSAYIVMLGDRSISENYFWDPGIACQSILLSATEQGFGGCMFGSANEEGIRGVFAIPPQYEVILVIGLGKPKETVVLDEVEKDGDIKYWRDPQQVHHVPKRKLEDIILDL
ncbi:nitroreductase family protein [Alkalibacter rhizosphaerae]|uniref:Nitroreductase family protein n=1 Tax=Alkalibacter rhizosphaerae TaxID=2815577 RepID=A0A974XFU0_9FIRM|nr:nitroreductase family protein [Alkalibacter rhizosphaerae]QSX09028.1 nitroreductase family protein [Alkalibacter rhizosphaerae]